MEQHNAGVAITARQKKPQNQYYFEQLRMQTMGEYEMLEVNE